MKRIVCSILILALSVTVVLPVAAESNTSSPLTHLQAVNIVGGALSDCVNAGIWGFGTILLSGTLLFGGIAAGIAITYLVDCVSG